MTKINGYTIPNEIKKPVEIVHELKTDYKVPSFEEFMKSYESDGNLNYDDLGGGSVGEVGGYGPCSPSYCSGCSCPRSDCNCRSSERFVKLYSACPAKDCPERDRSLRYPSHWYHSIDGRSTWISNQARIRCENSYCSTNHMSKWRFRCSAHRGLPEEYLSVNRDSFETALGWALTMKKDSSTSQLITDLVAWIATHPQEWNC